MKKKLISIFMVVLICFGMVFGSVAGFAASEVAVDALIEMLLNDAFAPYRMSGVADEITDELYSALVESGNIVYYEDDDCYYDTLTGYYYFIEDGHSYRSRSGGSGGGLNRDDVIAIDSPDDIPISGKTFKDIVNQLNEHYAPQARAEYVSAQDTNFPVAATDTNKTKQHRRLPFYTAGEFVGDRQSYEHVYITPFYVDSDGVKYIARYQYEYYVDTANNYVMTQVSHDNLGIKESSTATGLSVTEYPFIFFLCPSSGDTFNLLCYDSAEDYNKYASYTSNQSVLPMDTPYIQCSLKSNIVDISKFSILFTYENRADSLPLDYGYYISDELLAFDGYFTDIDTTQIPDDYIINLDGDDIYNSYITNTEGDTITLNEYITNNYTFNITIGGDDPPSGSISGDITVGGEITVGGQVDINVNVNTSGSGSEDDDNPTFDIAYDALYDYEDFLPEMSPEFSDYLGTFFNFLPPKLLGLIIGAIAAAVFCRVIGR